MPSISCTGRPAAGRHHPSCAIGRCPPQGQGDPGQTPRASLREREPLCRQPQGTPSPPRGSAPSLTGEGTEAQRAPQSPSCKYGQAVCPGTLRPTPGSVLCSGRQSPGTPQAVPSLLGASLPPAKSGVASAHLPCAPDADQPPGCPGQAVQSKHTVGRMPPLCLGP